MNGAQEPVPGEVKVEEARRPEEEEPPDVVSVQHYRRDLKPLSVADFRSRRHRVWLNIYDIDSATIQLNAALLKVNLGAFHCGVEVLGDEWFFAWGDSGFSGVQWTEPRMHRVHVFRESLCMGESSFDEDEIRRVVGDARDSWIANSYHPINRNCVTFAEELILALRCPEPFPVWVRGAIDAGKSPLVQPLATCAWNWVKWYMNVPAE